MMLLGVLLSAVVAWLSFMGLAASLLTANATGMFWYGIGMIVGGTCVRLFFDRL